MDYSIIIPHHNSSALLERLLNSIPMNGRFQVIVVDDNSTQEEYAAVEALLSIYAFELYQNEGRYAGGARNTGLKHAKADWLLFADADDYYVAGLEKTIDKYTNTDVDIVYFMVESRYSDTLEPAYRDTHIKNLSRLYKSKNDDNILRCRYTVPWGKLYKRSMIVENAISFDEVIAGNDIMFSVKTGVAANSVKFDDEVLYCVTVAQGSITRIKTKESFESRLQSYLRTNDFLKAHNKDKHQVALLGTLIQSRHFGFSYMCHVLAECIKHRTNLLFGVFDLERYLVYYRYRNH